MTHHIRISDQQTRYLSDAQLINRLARQVEAGIAARGRTVLVGGHTLPQLYDLDPTDLLWALRHPRNPHVDRRADGTTLVVLTEGVEVDIYPVRKAGGH